ncbi:ABC transporter ATP-binding protein [Vineibacter terrae]|uniref:ABC transporter ATP-binding protein n=1 Tax=Vineibacter terrae TaxID=2586908 RepID=UPI002E36F0C4|nr:ABC transporter ATP-binding protein [Vineibacter terrae]HEX2888726.1 ABC transporter ATP-binding protein [Vineibacter terrae]
MGQSDRGRVAVDGLVKHFGTVRAVDGVSLAAESGEFLALLGPSGSGKSTILMCIAGFEAPDAGRVTVGDRDVTAIPPQRRELGMVFQRYTLFPHMSVLDNIAFPLKMRGVARAEREARAREALATVRLADYGARMPAQLSGGQQQRVALARAIVYRPPVLLMDEPLSALDKALREEMQLEIKHLQRELGVTVVFVTHDQTEALTMADRIAVLDHGRLCQVGTPRDLYEAPQDPFVARFIGETNMLDGRALGDAAAGGRIGVRLPGDAVVEATAMAPLARDAAVVIAVRPERLRAADDGPVKGRMKEAIYAGVATTYVLETPGGATVRLRAATGANAFDLAEGGTVSLAWSAEDARAFPAEGGR